MVSQTSRTYDFDRKFLEKKVRLICKSLRYFKSTQEVDQIKTHNYSSCYLSPIHFFHALAASCTLYNITEQKEHDAIKSLVKFFFWKAQLVKKLYIYILSVELIFEFLAILLLILETIAHFKMLLSPKEIELLKKF